MIPADRPVLLDTGALVVLARGRAAGARLDERLGLRSRVDVPLLSAVSVGEVLALARKREWAAAKTERLQEILKNLVIIGIDRSPIWDAYARFSADLEQAGRRMGQQNDLWIAATAAASGAVLITLDKDFDDLHPVHLTRVYIDQRELLE